MRMRSIVSTLLLSVFGFLVPATARHAELLGSNVIGDSLLVIDPATGLATVDDGFISTFGDLTALEVRANGQLVGAVAGELIGPVSSRLIEIDRISNTETVLCDVIGLSIGALEEVDGVLYGVRNTGQQLLPNFRWQLVTIGDPVAGNCPVALIGDTSFSSPLFEFEGLAWDEGSEQFKGCASEQLILHNPEGGITTRHCTITLPDPFCENYASGLPGECGALTFDDAGRLLAARDGDLVAVNPTTGAETPIGNTSADPLERIEGLTLRSEPTISVGDFIGTTGMALFGIDPFTANPAFQAAIGSLGNITETEEMPRDAGDDLMLIGAVGGGGAGNPGPLVVIDPATGSETFHCDLNPAGLLNGMEYIERAGVIMPPDQPVLYGAYVATFDAPSSLVIVGDPVAGVCDLTFIGNGIGRETGFGPMGGLAYDEETDILLGCTADPILGGGGQILQCDPDLGTCVSLGSTGYLSCSSLEIGPDGQVYVGTGGGAANDGGKLLSVDGTGVGGPAEGGGLFVTEIGAITSGASISSLLFVTPGTVQPGDLIGSTREAGPGGLPVLVDVDSSTGAASFRADLLVPSGSGTTEIEILDDGTVIGSTFSVLYRIDPDTGIESPYCSHAGEILTGLESVNGVLYGSYATSVDVESRLVIVGGPDPLGNCQLTDIGGTGQNHLGGLAYDGLTDTLYGCTADPLGPFISGDLVTCDRTTGACASVGPTGFVACSSLEFDPDGTLFGGTNASGGSPSLITVDPATGTGTAVGATGFGGSLSGLDFVPPAPPPIGSLLGTSSTPPGPESTATLIEFTAPGVPAEVKAAIPPVGSRLAEIEMRADGTLFGVAGGILAGGVLGSNIFTVNPVTGQLIQHCSFGAGALQALEFIGDTLYGVHVPVVDGPANLVTVGDPDALGECPLTVIGPTGTGAMGGLASATVFAEGGPATTLFGCTSDTLDDPPNDSGVLYTCNIVTGACTAVGPTGLTSCSSLEDIAGSAIYAGGQDGDLYLIDDPFGVPSALLSNTGTGRPLSGLAFIEDFDGDGTIDSLDNCPNFPNAAPLDCDTDGDGFGNRCDGDLDNNGFTGFPDLFLFGQAFQAQVMGTYTPDADFDCSGFVNFADLGIFGDDLFGNPPGVVEGVSTDKASGSDAGFGTR